MGFDRFGPLPNGVFGSCQLVPHMFFHLLLVSGSLPLTGDYQVRFLFFFFFVPSLDRLFPPSLRALLDGPVLLAAPCPSTSSIRVLTINCLQQCPFFSNGIRCGFPFFPGMFLFYPDKLCSCRIKFFSRIAPICRPCPTNRPPVFDSWRPSIRSDATMMFVSVFLSLLFFL